MQRFVARQNIAHYERMLGGEPDHRKRMLLERLLVDARRDLAWLEGIWSWTCPHLGIPDAIGVAAHEQLDGVVRALGAHFGSLQLWDEADGNLYLIAHFNFDRPSVERFGVVRAGDGTVCDAACATQATVTIEDIETEEAFASLRDWTRRMGIRAIRTTPVFARSGRFIGAFSTHYANPRAFPGTEDEVNAISASRFSDLFAELGRA